LKNSSLKTFLWTLKNLRSIKNWKKRNFFPPSPEFIKHQIIKNNNLKDSIWIETGTYYGETTKILSAISKKTVTIEADEYLYNNVKNKLNHLSNVEFLLGKSEETLTETISSNSNFNNMCIYLDAHLCSDHLRNKKTFGNEDNATPIMLELNIIEKFLDSFKNINILIDDIRLFDKDFQNYPNKRILVEWCVKNKLSWEIEHDIFICKKIIKNG
tara:strand:+ start:500 stop:1141 length:642 start_codon:yes stop_codon:yes gene_type:complete